MCVCVWQFLRTVCNAPDIGLEPGSEIPTLDDACGVGTSEVDVSAGEYVEIITDAIALVEGSVETVIPEAQIDELCEVQYSACFVFIKNQITNPFF